MVNSIAKYKVFSTIDLRSVYYQVPLAEEDRPFTTFEADGKLWQHTRVPFGSTNGVLCFQCEMDNFVANYELNDIFQCMDNVTICGDNQGEQDILLKAFREAPSKINPILNEEKCVFSVEEIGLLCYRILQNSLKPDPNCLEPLLSLPVKHTICSRNRCLRFCHICNIRSGWTICSFPFKNSSSEWTTSLIGRKESPSHSRINTSLETLPPGTPFHSYKRPSISSLHV